MFRTTPMPRAVMALAATAATLALAPAAAQAATFTDDTVAEFNQGTTGANTAVGQVAGGAAGDGDVRLGRTQPTATEEFDGAILPPGWTSTPWQNPPTGTATVANGAVSVDGTLLRSSIQVGAGATMEANATFTNSPFEHIGMSQDYNEQPWAMFSTGGGALGVGLYARTRRAGQTVDQSTNTQIPVAEVDPLIPHDYRIVRRDDRVTYFVDGVQKAEHTIVAPDTLPATMPVAVSDFVDDNSEVAVRSVRVLFPHQSNGTYTSRVLDGGERLTGWQPLTVTAATPAGTTMVIQTSTGNTATPDASWSAFEPLGAGGAVASPARRYLQYRAVLNTTDVTASSALDKVSVNSTNADPPVVTPPSGGGGNQGGGGNSGGGTPPVVTPPVVTPPTTPGDTTRPRPRLSGSTAKVNGSRYATLKVKCSNEQSCRIVVKLRRAGKTIGSKTITVQGNSTKQLKLRLSKSAYKTLEQRGSLKVNASLAARDAAGNTGTASAQIKLRAPGR